MSSIALSGASSVFGYNAKHDQGSEHASTVSIAFHLPCSRRFGRRNHSAEPRPQYSWPSLGSQHPNKHQYPGRMYVQPTNVTDRIRQYKMRQLQVYRALICLGTYRVPVKSSAPHSFSASKFVPSCTSTTPASQRIADAIIMESMHLCTIPLMRQRTVQYFTALRQNPSKFCSKKGLRMLKQRCANVT